MAGEYAEGCGVRYADSEVSLAPPGGYSTKTSPPRVLRHQGDTWLADANTLNDEMTLVDTKAFTKPWMVLKTYQRAEAGYSVREFVCFENNRNSIGLGGRAINSGSIGSMSLIQPNEHLGEVRTPDHLVRSQVLVFRHDWC